MSRARDLADIADKDITGTVTVDGLTVENTGGSTLNINTNLVGADSKILLHEGSTASPANGASIRYAGATNEFSIGVGSSVDTKRLSIARDTGDISFYEDTGTTPKFFWDASAESLGIGTSSPYKSLTVGSTDASAWITSGGSNVHLTVSPNGASGSFIVRTGGTNGDPSTTTERMRIDSSGNVGIGTSSPQRTLHVHDDSTYIQITNDTTGTTSSDGFRMGYFTGQTIFTMNQQENDGLAFSTNNTERMRIDSSGNVGIGEASVDSKFHVKDNLASTGVSSSSSPIVIIQNERTNTGTSSSVLRFDTNEITGTNQYARAAIGAEYDGSSNVNGRLMFSTADTSGTLQERMRIDSSGHLLVGTTTKETQGVTLYGTGGNGFYIKTTGTCGYLVTQAGTGGAGNLLTLYSDTSLVGAITTNGTSTSYETTSDYRLKTDAQPMTGASARVQALNPVNFEWIADGTRVDGFLAHEAQEVVPEAVTGTKDAMRDEEYEVTPAVYEDVVIPAVLDEDGNEIEAERTEQQLVTEAVMGTRSVPDYQGIDQSKLVPLLTAALQEALIKIDALETRITALEG